MDWRDLKRTDRITVYQLDPVTGQLIGKLDGAELGGASIDAAYYSDTRTSGKLSVQGEGWQRGAFVRFVHEVPEWGYSNTLGTYVVTDDAADRNNGAWAYGLTLHSTLYALDLDKLVKPWTIAANASALTAARQIMAQTPFGFEAGTAYDARMKSTSILETGTSRLSALFAISQATRNRVDVDGYGRITMQPYTSPASKAPKYRIDLSDPQGVALDGLSRSADWLEMPDTVAVAHRYSETVNGKSREREIRATAGGGIRADRGYRVVDFRDVNELSPKTAARAQQLAAQYLAEDSREQVEWQLTTTYLPLWEGDVVELVVHDGDERYQGARKCLVKSLTLDLQPLRMKLTLKETASGDDE